MRTFVKNIIMKKRRQNNKLAFSLIELSIVILVIGILVLGITKGSTIIRRGKLSSARALTASSPVNSISGLTLWLETTSTRSFNGGLNNGGNDTQLIQDGASIANWYDIGNQGVVGTIATQATTANQPIYKENGINGMPALLFNGATSAIITNSSSIIDNNSYSIFIVEKRTSAVSGGIFCAYNSIGTSSGVAFFYRNPTELDVEHYINNGGGGYDYAPVTVTAGLFTRIISTTFIGGSSNNGTLNIYFNGSNVYYSNARSPVGTPYNYQYFIGSNSVGINPANYNGYIGEVIVFDRVLNPVERHGIETYLGNKWGVTMSVS